MPKLTWLTRIEPSVTALGIEVRIAFTRTAVHGIQLAVDGVDAWPSDSKGGPGDSFVVGFLAGSIRWAEPMVLPAGVLQLSFAYTGEAPILTSFAFIREDEPDHAVHGALHPAVAQLEDTSLEVGYRLAVHEAARSAKLVPEWTQEPETEAGQRRLLFRERWRASQAHARASAFFTMLDSCTDEKLANWPLQSDLIERLVYFSDLRQFAASHGGVRLAQPLILDQGGLLQSVQDTARILEVLFQSQNDPTCDRFTTPAGDLAGVPLWPWSKGELNVSPLEYAFECFAAGRLAIVHPATSYFATLQTHGVPNNALFFSLFAGFALLLGNQKLPGWELWLDHARLFVYLAHSMVDPLGATGFRRELYFTDGVTQRMLVIRDLRSLYRTAFPAEMDANARLQALDDAFTWVCGRLIAPAIQAKGVLSNHPLEVPSAISNWCPPRHVGLI